jgi:hypothetical protein
MIGALEGAVEVDIGGDGVAADGGIACLVAGESNEAIARIEGDYG